MGVLVTTPIQTLKSYFSDNGLKLFPIDDDDAKSGILDKLFGHSLRKLEALEAPKHEENDGSFSNSLNDLVSKLHPVLQGGIFADESNLGKMLSLLSLIGSDNVVSKEDGSVTENRCSDFVRKTTLIVCPNFVVYQYNENDRTDDFEVLHNNDIVLTTYSTLLDDDHKKRKCYVVDKVVWWRVIYDEAHELKSMSRTHKAVTNLQA
ncbi:putative swi/snf-related matrix-associated actin-dependent regulator of chromatin subfamily a member 3-like 1 [Quercus suber]|uniref:Swi/snf-related matrix-associated actin-dependent regulator of chromatin subfamily a member 3-like 1 n=1 Tax=Quercus suber TaxID=58331 RepID=A0AAW0L677_QUESU